MGRIHRMVKLGLSIDEDLDADAEDDVDEGPHGGGGLSVIAACPPLSDPRGKIDNFDVSVQVVTISGWMSVCAAYICCSSALAIAAFLLDSSTILYGVYTHTFSEGGVWEHVNSKRR